MSWRRVWGALFWLVKAPVVLALMGARRKGLVFLLLFAVFTHLDQLYPMLGGKMTVIGTVILPAVFVWMSIWLLYAWGIAARHFFLAGTALGYAATMGLLKAWVAAAGSELPTWLLSALTMLLGLPALVGVGIVAEVGGWSLPPATRLMHPDGLAAHLRALDPLLVIVSLCVLIFAARTVNIGRKRWLSDKMRTPKHLTVEARNTLLTARRGCIVLGGVLKGRVRRLAAIFSPSVRLLKHDQVVVACALPSEHQSIADKLRSVSALKIGTALSQLGFQFELSSLDCNPLVVASVNAHALAFGGSGSGKTLGPRQALIQLRSAGIVSFDVQRNARQFDVPCRLALGRKPLLFDALLGAESASCNISANLIPGTPGFATGLRKRHKVLVPEAPETGSNDDIRKRVRSCTQTVHAGLISDCLASDEQATLAEVYRIIKSPDLVPFLEWTADHGPIEFRGEAASLAEDLSNPDGVMMNSLQLFIDNECSWLADREKCALIDGTTDFPTDAKYLLGDEQKIDWLIQCDDDDVEDAPALYQLLILEVIDAHMQRPTAECTGLPRTMLLVDELPALLPSLGSRFTKVLERGRQKGLLGFFLMQSSEQLDGLLGHGTTTRWEKNATVVIYARPDDAEEAERISAKVGDTVVQSESISSPPGGEGLQAEMKSIETRRAISATELMEMADGDCLVIARSKRGKRTILRGRMPNCFVHPYLRRGLLKAREKFGAPDIPRLALPSPSENPIKELPAPTDALPGE